MDRKLPDHPEILRLVRLGEVSRALLENEADKLRRKLDVPSRIRGSLKDHPSSWLFGSLATGLAASLLLRRSPAPVKKHRGFTATLMGLTLTAARPLAKVWLADQLKHWIASQSAKQPVRSIPQTPNSP